MSGRLAPALGGSLLGVENRGYIFNHTSRDETTYSATRRSVYLPVVRNNLHDVFTLFDYTDASVPNGNRGRSVVPAQALFLLNSELPAEAAESLARDVLAERESTAAARLASLYQRVHGREPNETESNRAADFLAPSEALFAAEENGAATAEARAWQMLAHTLLISNEFLYIR